MTRPTQRLDKWLWQARFFRTRSLAAREIAAGHCRVNGARVTKPAAAVGAGDVLTFVQARRVRVVRVTGLPDRRGPAPEAQAHYEDFEPPQQQGAAAPADAGGPPEPEPGGRPTKRARRNLETMRRRALE
ncbi:RNA-binding S4 domain-containing protein [Rhodosalinus sp.]|uniref:RNA-binding S4 domain-containing protein n=1 Tax=Rhodosalinus sp. TaxID=2047741 RepID=UPI00397DE865